MFNEEEKEEDDVPSHEESESHHKRSKKKKNQNLSQGENEIEKETPAQKAELERAKNAALGIS